MAKNIITPYRNGFAGLDTNNGDDIMIAPTNHKSYTFWGNGGSDTITALGDGNHKVYLDMEKNTDHSEVTLGNGNNYVVSGIGHDTITVGNGCNIIDDTEAGGCFGKGAGDDIFIGSGSNKIYFGDVDGKVTETVAGARGNNIIDGGDGSYNIDLSKSNGDNQVYLTGSDSHDTNIVKVGNGNNIVNVGDAKYTVVAGNGNNVFATGDGNGSITMGSGKNIVWEGDGSDHMVFKSFTGNQDVIHNFGHSGMHQDFLDLTAFHITAANLVVTNVGFNTVITDNISGAGDPHINIMLAFEHLSKADMLASNDFIF